VGKLKDGNGHVIANIGLRGLAFRSDGFGDPDTLYFTSEFQNEEDGLFGAITTGLVSLTRVSAPDTPTNTSATITATVAAALDNPGAPTGTVTFLDDTNRLGTAPLVNGSAALDAVLSGVRTHNISALYSGDAVFLASSDIIAVQVMALPTMLNLVAPANAVPGSAVTLTATINSTGGTPTGEIVFHDGNTDLGTSPLNGAGVATLRINTLTAGAHSLTASYAGDGKFGGSTSAGVTINIANADFSLGATPTSATVVAGQSTQIILAVTPAGGFANSVTFSCSPIIGITCAFSPATVTPCQWSREHYVDGHHIRQRFALRASDAGPARPLRCPCRISLIQLRDVACQKCSNSSYFTADRRGRGGDCCPGARHEWLWRIQQQHAAKPGHRFNHGHRPVWEYFSHDNRSRSKCSNLKERR